jgi:hypothetical protein
MFDAVRSRPSLVLPGLLALAVAAAAAVAWTPFALPRARAALRGGDPFAEPFAVERRDFPYRDSPLARALALDPARTDDERERSLRAADDLARELGWWWIDRAGVGDIDAAERAAWDPDAFAARWAEAVRDRRVYARAAVGGAFLPAPPEPTYVHPDELVWLFLHVAWRLDLRAEAVPSPVHVYALLREPGGERVRGVEPTCFRCSEDGEPGVGVKLTFPEDFFSSGVGGIRNPPRPIPGTYLPLGPDDLEGAVLRSVEARRGADPERLLAHLAAHPDDRVAAELLARSATERALAAEQAGDWAAVEAAAAALARLRSDHPDLLPPHRDDLVVDAILAFHRGDEAAGRSALRRALAPRDAEWGAAAAGKAVLPKSPAHDRALWLHLEHEAPTHAAWNDRVVPLLAKHHADTDAVARLCAWGRRALAGTTTTPEAEYPGCRP